MKGHLGLRAVFHHRADRIRAHVQLCWPALLLIHVIENTTSNTWRNIRHELDRMHLIMMQIPEGTVAQRTALTAGQKTILSGLDLGEPRRFYDFTTTAMTGAPGRCVPPLAGPVVIGDAGLGAGGA